MATDPAETNDRSWAHFSVLLGWLLASAATSCRREVIVTLVLSFTGTILQASAFLGLVAFVQASQTDWTITLFRLRIHVDHSTGGLVAFALVLALALVLSAACNYVARLVAVRLAVSYEHISARRAAHVIACRRFGPRPEDADLPDDRTLQTLLTRGPRYLGRAIIELLNATTPVVTAVVAAIFMLYWQPVFTLLILLVMGVSAPFHLLVIRTGMTSGRDLSTFARADTLAKVDVINALRKRPFARADDEAWIDERLSGEKSRRYLDAYGIRLRIAHMSFLVSNLTMALVLCVLALYFGSIMLRGDDGIAHVLLYVVALKYFLGGVSAAFKTFTTLNIFYVYFELYLRLIGTRTPTPPSGTPITDVEWRELIATAPPGDDALALRPGAPMTLICRPPLSWLTLPAVVSRRLGLPSERAADVAATSAVVASDYPPVSDDLATCLSAPDDFDLDRVIDEWPLFAERLERYRAIASSPWSADDWAAVGPDLKCLFALLAALRRPEIRILVIDEVALRSFRPEELAELWERLSSHAVIVAYAAVPRRLAHLKTGMVGVLRDAEVAWTGRAEDFLDERDAAADAFEGAAPAPTLEVGTELDELDL